MQGVWCVLTRDKIAFLVEDFLMLFLSVYPYHHPLIQSFSNLLKSFPCPCTHARPVPTQKAGISLHETGTVLARMVGISLHEIPRFM